MVCTFKPPGVSRALANNLRAALRSFALGWGMPASRMASSRAVSSSVTQWPRVENTRSAMLAAAALVKVMQRIFSGGTPDSSSRITRWTRTCVLPEPALAETKAEASGSEARFCAARTASGMGRGAFTIPRSPFFDSEAAGRRPFLDAGEIVISAVAVGPHRQVQRAIRLLLVLELADEHLELLACIVSGLIGGVGGVARPDFQLEAP